MTEEVKKVVILDGSVAKTGAFVSAREMARALIGSADVILVLPDNARIVASELADFAAIKRLPIRPLRRNLSDIALYLPRLILATWQLRRLMLQHRGAVLLVNDFYLIHGPLLRFFGHRSPIVTWIRIDPAAFGRMGRIWLFIAASFSDRMVAVSRHVQNLMPSSIAADLLHNPLSAEFMPTPVTKKVDRDQNQCIFVFLGNYIEGKGQDVALDAFALLLRDVPQAKLRFYGGDMGLARNQAYRNALETKAASLGISFAVTFGDFVLDPRGVLDQAFAALNLSRSESFSRTVLEANARGLPVIATRSGGPAEIIVDGETGFMIPIGDVSACAAAMRKLCENPDLAARMGSAGRDHVLRTFGPEAFACRLRTLIMRSY